MYHCANGASQGSRGRGHVYEINAWLWNFGRPQPRVGGLSVAKTEQIRRKSRSELARRAWKTKKCQEAASWKGRVQLKIYDMLIPAILCHIYLYHLWLLSKTWFSRDCVVFLASESDRMHMYILVQTSCGNFVVISSVKTQSIEKHKILAYTKDMFVLYLSYTTAVFNTV